MHVGAIYNSHKLELLSGDATFCIVCAMATMTYETMVTPGELKLNRIGRIQRPQAPNVSNSIWCTTIFD